MSISTPGVGSGLDISTIIDQLMAIERQPLLELGVDQVELEAQLSGFGKLKSAISLFEGVMQDLASPDNFKIFKAESSDAEVLGASADSTAAKGTFVVDVQRVAENHRMAATQAYQDTDSTPIGEAGDSIEITVGNESFAVETGDKTLGEIRDAINSASGNTGVTASILKDDVGYYLTLSANDTGSDNFISVSYLGGDPFDPGSYPDADTTTVRPAGYTMSIDVAGSAFDVDIGGLTLDGIRDAINGAPGNTGVTAAVTGVPGDYTLTLTPTTPGDVVTKSYSAPDPFGFNDLNADRDGSSSFEAADLDAVVTLENTFTVTSTDNTISDAIQGVTLRLEQAGSTTLRVDRDDSKIESSVQQFLGVYNEVVNTIADLRGNVLAEERTSLISLEAQFRSVLNSAAGDSELFSFLFEIGVSTQLDGTLTLDSKVFRSALDDDPEGVADMFSNPDTGLATRFDALAGRLTEAGGLFDGREQSLNSQIRQIESRRINLEARLVRKEESLVEQFSALDALVASLNTTSSFLTTQLEQIAATTKSSNGN
ncbi:MAG: flagellar filament capping protein FliD [Gammaproteobacteria bacterium]